MERFYNQSHEWALIDGDEATVGLSRFATDEIGEIIHVALPQVGDSVQRGERLAEIESVKSVNEFYAPIAGTVTAINPDLEQRPELVNQDPLEAGWFVRLRPAEAEPTAGLLDEASYLASNG